MKQRAIFVQVADGSKMDMDAQAAVASNGTLHLCISEDTEGPWNFKEFGREHVDYLYGGSGYLGHEPASAP